MSSRTARRAPSALEAGDVNMIHTDDGENIAKFRSEADKFPMTEIVGVRRDRLHAAEGRRSGRAPAVRPAGALRDGVRDRRAGTHRQASARHQQGRERSVLPDPGRLLAPTRATR